MDLRPAAGGAPVPEPSVTQGTVGKAFELSWQGVVFGSGSPAYK